MKLAIGLLGILAILISSADAVEKKPIPAQPSPVRQARPVQQPRAIQQVRPPQQGRLGQRPNTFATPQSAAQRNGSFGTTGGAPAVGYPAPRRAFGTGSAAQNGGSEGRHFGGAGAGTHSASVAPRRTQNGRSYAYHGHSFSPFHAERYRWPHGYHYRRYAVGYRLPHSFWIRDYYLDNYADYGLDPPPVDFEWVRYGPDALLIDLDSGAIAQVVYGAFDDTPAGNMPADAPPDPSSDQ